MAHWLAGDLTPATAGRLLLAAALLHAARLLARRR
jgi:hypothetical protein